MKQCTECKREYKEEKTYCPYDGTLLTSLKGGGDSVIDTTIDNKYHIDFKIAEGGMGNVYKGTHMQLNSPVAIKVMHSSLISDQTAIERMIQDAKVLTKSTRDVGVNDVSDFSLIRQVLKSFK